MATEYTPNYNLDLYTSTDKPNLRDQYNAAMGKIDTQLKANADGVTNVSASVVAATAAANEAKELAENAAPKNHANATGEYGLASSLQYGHVALAKVEPSSIEESGKATSPKAVYDFVNNGYAQKNHATNTTLYGGGTSQNFGHVQLTDSAVNSQNASLSVAATPKCVDNKIAAALESEPGKRWETLIPWTTVPFSGGVTGGSMRFQALYSVSAHMVYLEWNLTNTVTYNPTGQTLRFDIGTLPNYAPGSNRNYAVLNEPDCYIEVRATGKIDIVFGGSQAFSLHGSEAESAIYIYD